MPGSILDNAQSQELRTYLAGQIARAASIYNVDEIIIFDDKPPANIATAKVAQLGDVTARPCCVQFARILQYLECPQYLRKFFFPIHNDLKHTGLLNPLDSQHHLRIQSTFPFREGIVSSKPHPKGSYVNAGLLNDVLVDKQLPENLRVTVKIPLASQNSAKKLHGKIVSPQQPRKETGIYWGYNVRIANSISEIFSRSPYENGYDLTIGTSDKGEHVQKVENKSMKFNHLLIVFGGLLGLENAVENDDNLTVEDPSLLFDHYINVAPQQGSRTIRTEEAVLITMASLSEKLAPNQPAMELSKELSDLIAQSEDTGRNVRNMEPMKRKNKVKKPRVENNNHVQKPQQQNGHSEQQLSGRSTVIAPAQGARVYCSDSSGDE